MNLDPALLDLFDAACDRTITPEAFERLQSRLLADPSAREGYCHYLNLHSSIRRYAIAAGSPASSAAIAARAADRSPRLAPRGVGSAGPLRSRRRAIASVSLAAAVVLIGVVGYLAIRTAAPVPSPAGPPAQPVATVIDTSDDATLVVNDHVVLTGSEVRTGDYALDAGMAELRMNNGVSVAMHGQTRLRVDGPMSARLDAGVARFDCPHEARGFTVALPGGGRVVDLGTAFAVQVDERTHRVWVTEGSVVLYASADAPPHRIDANAGAVVGPDGAVAAAQRMPASLADALEPSRVTLVAHYRMGDDDPDASLDQPAIPETANAVPGGQPAAARGRPVYSDDTPTADSRLSMRFDRDSGLRAPNPLRGVRDNFGVEAWVKIERAYTNGSVVSLGNTGTNYAIYLEFVGNYAGMITGVGSVGGEPARIGRWTHVAFVREGGVATTYIDGRRMPGGSPVGVDPSDDLHIGQVLNPSGVDTSPFEGLIDDVRVFTFEPGSFDPDRDLHFDRDAERDGDR